MANTWRQRNYYDYKLCFAFEALSGSCSRVIFTCSLFSIVRSYALTHSLLLSFHSRAHAHFLSVFFFFFQFSLSSCPPGHDISSGYALLSVFSRIRTFALSHSCTTFHSLSFCLSLSVQSSTVLVLIVRISYLSSGREIPLRAW